MRIRDATSIASETNPECFLFLGAFSLVTIYTLAPFEFVFDGIELLQRADEALRFKLNDRARELAGHFAAFGFLGGIAGTLARFKAANGFRRLLCYGGLFCVALEILQLPQASRHARLSDTICNTGAWALGAWLTTRSPWAPSLARRTSHLRKHAFALYLSFFLAAACSWIVAGVKPLTQLRSLDWDRDFRLRVANEEDGSEPWNGDIHYIRIYGSSLHAESVRRLSKHHGSAPHFRQGTDPEYLVGYDFNSCELSSSHLRPRGTVKAEPLIMDAGTGISASLRGNSVRFANSSGLSSRSSAHELTDAIVKSGGFSIEALLQPLAPSEKRPARIISLSSDLWYRNFMLGQEGSDLVFRVRNGVNGENALKHACSAPRVVDDSLQHFVAAYDHGVSTLYRNGKHIGQITDVRDPALLLGLGSAQASWAAAAILLIIFVAVPAYFVTAHFMRTFVSHACAVILAVAIGCLPYALSPLIVGGPCRLAPLLWITAAFMTCYPWALSYVSSKSVSAGV